MTAHSLLHMMAVLLVMEVFSMRAVMLDLAAMSTLTNLAAALVLCLIVLILGAFGDLRSPVMSR
jgi:hypothetical protein